VELVAARYMTRFRCLGGDCEDNCCHTWRVYVDRKHFERLRDRMASPAERAEFNANIRRADGESGRHRYALIVFRENTTACAFLDGAGLCTVHGRYGEELLGDTCAIYPRQIGRIGERMELVGAPSCPEVARLLLLHDDAGDRVPAEPALLGRGWITRAVDPAAKDPYEANFLAVRGLIMDLLHARKYPLASRLFFIAFFADRSRGYLRRGAKSFDAEGLRELGHSLQDVENRDTLHRQLQRSLADVSYAVRVVREVLRVFASNLQPEHLPLVNELEDLFAEKGAPLPGDALAVLRVYNALPALPAELATRLDTIVERYVAHDLVNNWFTDQPSFVGYYHQLLARAATVRFLVGAHARSKPPADRDAFDALAIRVVYLLSRLFEHSNEFVGAMLRAFEEEGLELGHAVALTRL
jgi:lysine-N-methylase